MTPAGKEEMKEELKPEDYSGAMLQEGITSFIADNTGKPIAVFSRDILINTFQKDVPKIESSFDNLYMSEMKKCSQLVSDTSAILIGGFKASDSVKDDLRLTCGHLLMNALTSCMAAFQIMRSGYRLQPGILARNIIENVATALHLLTHPDDLSSVRSGDFDSTRSIKSAKKVLPVFGKLYGEFTDRFAHIGILYTTTQPLTEYSREDEALKDNLWMVKLSIWSAYIASELTFLDNMNSPRYWKSLGPTSGTYSPSNEEKEWLKDFLGLDKADV